MRDVRWRLPRLGEARSRGGDTWTAALSLAAYLLLGWSARRSVGRTERGLFARFNHDGRDEAVLRVPQQLGTPWVLPALSVVGLISGRHRLAVSAAVSLPLEKGLEVGVKKLLTRPRPAQVDERFRLRDDAPEDGPSYPSGHAALAFAAAVLGSRYVPPPVAAAGLAAAATASVVRVRQGAHFPVDAIGGALLGVGVACTARSATDRIAGIVRQSAVMP